MYIFQNVMDHIEVYDLDGCFLYSADTLQEANEMMVEK